MTICAVPGCDEHFACRMRAKGVQYDPVANSTRTKRHTPGKTRVHNSWERGVAREDRPGGFQLPIIKPDGTPVRMKEAAQKRAIYDEARARRRAQGGN